MLKCRTAYVGFRHSFVIRHSTFVIWDRGEAKTNRLPVWPLAPVHPAPQTVVAPGIISSFTSQRIRSRAISFSSMTMSSLPPTMSNVGAWTFGNASPARSGRPPRETTAPTSCGSSAAATSAAAPPVLEPKYPMRKSRVSSCCRAHFVACTRRWPADQC